MLESLRSKKVLVVVAHPDDEVLGVGGTIHRLVNDFDAEVHTVILGEGITSRADHRDPQAWKEELIKHKHCIEQARLALGYHSVSIYDFPDNRFDTVALLDIVKVVEKEKQTFKPDAVFTHHLGDVNIDHQRTFEAVITACRPIQGDSVKAIICFETMSGTEWRASSDPRHFIPNFFVSLTEIDLESKVKAMESYAFEKRKYPHPRSPKALKIRAKMWGIANGLNFAEAFSIIRRVDI